MAWVNHCNLHNRRKHRLNKEEDAKRPSLAIWTNDDKGFAISKQNGNEDHLSETDKGI